MLLYVQQIEVLEDLEIMKRACLKTLVLALVFSLTLTGILSAHTSGNVDYVALGDSLAAGSTPNGAIDKSYTDFIAEKLDGEGILGDYQNFGKPGHTTVKVLADINPSNPDNADRINAISNAEIITLDVGANDLLDSIPVLMANPSHAPAEIEKVANNIAQITGTLKGINPNTKIYLIGYYNAFYPFSNYTDEQKAQVGLMIRGFNLAVEQVAAQTGTSYVDIYTTMDKHLAKYLPEENIHPDIQGYRAIAKDFWDIIKVDFLRGEN